MFLTMEKAENFQSPQINGSINVITTNIEHYGTNLMTNNLIQGTPRREEKG